LRGSDFSSPASFLLHERLSHLFAKPSTQGGDGMEPKGFHRKLTAILSTDVAGYSRVTDEDETVIAPIKSHRNLIDEKIRAFKGRSVNSPGDNILAGFGSIVDAIACTVGIQNELKVKNPDLPKFRSTWPSRFNKNPIKGLRLSAANRFSYTKEVYR